MEKIELLGRVAMRIKYNNVKQDTAKHIVVPQ
jgi:hypothetical protein